MEYSIKSPLLSPQDSDSGSSNDNLNMADSSSSGVVKPSTLLTLEEAFEMMPVSIFHLRLLFVCGLAFMADSMEVALLSFISICAGILV